MSVPFSPAQFEKKPNRFMPRTRVRMDRVVATQTSTDPAKVRDIARQPASAISTDPIVHPFGGKLYLSDGHNRFEGARLRGDSYIWVRRAR